MNNFNTTIISETFYPSNNYVAPVMIIDEIKLEPKTVLTQIAVQAPMNVLKNIAAIQLSEEIIDSMNHTSIFNYRTNTYYERFSFTYAEKNKLDILEQQLDNRTKALYIAQDKLDAEIMKNEYLNKQIDIRNYIIAVLSIISTTLYILKYL